MRKNFLLTFCVLTFLGATNAQASGELFPDLAKRNKPQTQQAPQDKDFKLFEDNVSYNFPESSKEEMATQEEVVDQTIKKTEQKDEKKPTNTPQQEKKKQSGFFEIYPHDVQIITPPVDAESQFCKASLSLENSTKYNLKSLKLVLQYGPAKINYTFNPVLSGATGTGNLFMMGTACQGLKQTAQITVTGCQAERISDAECKQLVRYILK